MKSSLFYQTVLFYFCFLCVHDAHVSFSTFISSSIPMRIRHCHCFSIGMVISMARGNPGCCFLHKVVAARYWKIISLVYVAFCAKNKGRLINIGRSQWECSALQMCGLDGRVVVWSSIEIDGNSHGNIQQWIETNFLLSVRSFIVRQFNKPVEHLFIRFRSWRRRIFPCIIRVKNANVETKLDE